MSDENVSEIKSTSPLTDIEDIVTSRPELEAHEWEIVNKATPWLKATLRPDVRKDLDAEYIRREAEYRDELRKENAAYVKAEMEKWKAEQKPLDAAELKTLLSQEYDSFPVKLQVRENKKTVEKEFILCELPQNMEKKFADTAKKKLVTIIEKAAAMDWNVDMSTAQQLQSILDTLPEALDVAAELAAICLNPWGDDAEITSDWVQNNIGTYRISLILIAQGEVNKYRDFFSNGFRLFRSLKTR